MSILKTLKIKCNKLRYAVGVRLLAISIVYSYKLLTPDYLIVRGWVEESDNCYSEPNVKDRDKITIEFEKDKGNYFYRVYHSKNKTFVALESSVEWFELYYSIILMHNEERYNLAGV